MAEFQVAGEQMSFVHAAIAIGILIVQDIFAVSFLVLTSDKMPSIWALALLALPLLRPALTAILNRAGHGELLVLSGLRLKHIMGYSFVFFLVAATILGTGFTLVCFL